jgi:hypothetical protein
MASVGSRCGYEPADSALDAASGESAMKIDFERFKGSLPYASELFGIYQPLLGWKSKMTEDRLARDHDAVIRSLSERAVARTRSDVLVRSGPTGLDVTELEIRDVVLTRSLPRVAREIDSIVARKAAQELPVDRQPTTAEWASMFERERLREELHRSKQFVEKFVDSPTPVFPKFPPDLLAYVAQIVERERSHDRGSPEIMKAILDREVSVSSYLQWLAEHTPEVLNILFYRKVSDPFEDLVTFTGEALSSIGQNGLSAVLSPIGVVHLFRQYFFEFDTFLGPPVGHVWLSPGATLELVEEVVKRALSERTVESLIETTDKTEKTIALHDELSSAIREENRSSLKFGFGASVEYDNGTLEAGAHADLSLENARTTAREAAHKRTRDQSEKVSSEIRRSFKSTFRTVVETTSTNSRRYVLSNTTSELVNYELRRKMRQVGVQVQDIGTQLCWQVFVDDPGKDVGLAKLVHIAQPPDLASIHAPEPPAKLEPKAVEVNLQFPYMRDVTSEGEGETDVLYIEGDDGEHIGGSKNIGHNDRIINKKTYELTPPAPGYTLTSQFSLQHHHQGTVDPEVRLQPDGKTIEITLHQVNFKDQPTIELLLTTTWTPDPALQSALDAAYAAKLVVYDAEKSALERAAFLDAARTRIKVASQIRNRAFEDLREEERILVYRNLVGQLMRAGEGLRQDEHVTSELIRAIFDVDKMLYFVAPEWWRPRSHAIGHQLSVSPVPGIITDKDLVKWDGPMAANRTNDYLITEESDPAPMGSSLGWLLELDGDPFRNAFLNSPWVKAIIPIRPGKEEAALNWLSLAQVAGATGLDAAYDAPSEELQKIVDGLIDMGRVASNPVTLRDALLHLGHRIKLEYKEASTAKPSPFDPNKNVIPTETVFENGFDPLAGGFEVNVDPTRVFSQWIEVLATDQVAAVPYDAAEHL